MIIIWKHIRTAKMYTEKQLARGYTNRYIHLLDPVYWVNRDHCRLEGTPRKKTTKGRYLFVWISQYYTDQNGIKKKSIIPKYKLCIRSDTIRDKIRSYKNKIKKFYNRSKNVLRGYYTNRMAQMNFWTLSKSQRN